jgi:hypothetical protein
MLQWTKSDNTWVQYMALSTHPVSLEAWLTLTMSCDVMTWCPIVAVTCQVTAFTPSSSWTPVSTHNALWQNYILWCSDHCVLYVRVIFGFRSDGVLSQELSLVTILSCAFKTYKCEDELVPATMITNYSRNSQLQKQCYPIIFFIVCLISHK